jgi:hypothetical protein
MAVRNAAITYGEDGSFTAVWTGITEADSGSPISVPGSLKKATLQTVGDFTTSGAVTWQGSNDTTNYGTMQDAGGTDIVMVASTKIWRLESMAKRMRPQATAGTAVSMDVYLYGLVD